MSATSLKLSNDLRRRIGALVHGTDTTAHAFMLAAIERAAQQEELRRRFGDEAAASERETEKSGRAFDAASVFDYLEARGRGRRTQRPKLKSWRRSA
jgi:predicted transcriptional regulator